MYRKYHEFTLRQCRYRVRPLPDRLFRFCPVQGTQKTNRPATGEEGEVAAIDGKVDGIERSLAAAGKMAAGSC